MPAPPLSVELSAMDLHSQTPPPRGLRPRDTQQGGRDSPMHTAAVAAVASLSSSPSPHAHRALSISAGAAIMGSAQTPKSGGGSGGGGAVHTPHSRSQPTMASSPPERSWTPQLIQHQHTQSQQQQTRSQQSSPHDSPQMRTAAAPALATRPSLGLQQSSVHSTTAATAASLRGRDSERELLVPRDRPTLDAAQAASASVAPPAPANASSSSSSSSSSSASITPPHLRQLSNRGHTAAAMDRNAVADAELEKAMDALVIEIDRPITPSNRPASLAGRSPHSGQASPATRQSSVVVKPRASVASTVPSAVLAPPAVAYLPGSTDDELVVHTPLAAEDSLSPTPSRSPALQSSELLLQRPSIRAHTPSTGAVSSTSAAPPSSSSSSFNTVAVPSPPNDPPPPRAVSFALSADPVDSAPAPAELGKVVWVPGKEDGVIVEKEEEEDRGAEDAFADDFKVRITPSASSSASTAPTVVAAPADAAAAGDLDSAAAISSLDDDVDPDVGLMSCFCIRPVRLSVPRRFPTDDEIASGPSKARRAQTTARAAAASLRAKLALYAEREKHDPSPMIDFALTEPDPSPVDPYDRALGADFVDGALGPGAIPEPHPYLFVPEVQSCWVEFLRVIFWLQSLFEFLQLPLLALLHCADTMLDAAVMAYWIWDPSMSSHPFRLRFIIAGAVFMGVPVLLALVSDLTHPPPPVRKDERYNAAQEAPPFQLRLHTLLIMDLLQLRGFWECVLAHRQAIKEQAAADEAAVATASGRGSDASGSGLLFAPAATVPARDRVIVRMRETAEMQSSHLTRVIFECAPMLLLQAGVLALQYDARVLLDDGSANPIRTPPKASWEIVAVLSLIFSLLSITTVVYRFVCGSNVVWREKAGALGLACMALLLFLHPAHKIAGYVVLTLMYPWWIVVLLGLGSLVVTAIGCVYADASSPLRRANVASAALVIRTALLLAPLEFATGGIGAWDLVGATSIPKRNHEGAGAASRWVREYTPVLAWHALESTAVIVVYATVGEGRLWIVPIVGSMIVFIVGRILALAFLLPRINE